MELFFQYLRQQWKIYVAFLSFFAIFLVTFQLYHIPMEAVVYPTILCVLTGALFTVADYRRTIRKHKSFIYVKSILDVDMDNFPEREGIIEADYQEIIRLMKEEHDRFCMDTNQKYTDMVDYYTVWVHQIKTPIASMRLNLQNEDSEFSRKVYADLYRIEQYVEMVLTFLRLNSESTDYVIKEYNLDMIVRQAVKKLSRDFIGRRISLHYEPLEATVITDEKWLSFVIEQVISNALKYTRAGSITISMDDGRKLSIRDTGIGIAPEDLPRIFENGYTGFNGRMDKRASGIGLYLCKRICTNLGHTILASSVVDEGTCITIDFSQRKLERE